MEFIGSVDVDKKVYNMSKTRFYRIWRGIKSRCLNKNCNIYKNYGGRGIKIQSDWISFVNFYIDMFESYNHHVGIYGEKDTSIERKDVNWHYCKSNCIWATMKQQSKNRRNTRLFSYEGKKLTLTEWSVVKNISLGVLSTRIFKLNWDIERTLSTPISDVYKKGFFTYNGETLSLLEWSKKVKMNRNTLVNRVYTYKWPIEKALNTPVRSKLSRIA